MKNEKEIKDLLDRLRGELKPADGGRPDVPRTPSAAPAENAERFRAPIPVFRQVRREAPVPQRFEQFKSEPFRSAGANAVWSENKEAMLLGVMASLAAALGGALAGLDYLALAGTVAFMLFSFVMALTLFGYYLNFRENASRQSAGKRLEQLERKLDSLEGRSLSGAVRAEGGERPREKELERKVEELRKIVRSLVKAFGGPSADEEGFSGRRDGEKEV